MIADNIFFKTGSNEFSHGLYLSGNLGGQCNLLRNRMLRFSSSGHGFKLGCAGGLIESNELLMLDGAASPPIDIFTGGDWVVRDNTIQIGPNRENSQAVRLAPCWVARDVTLS